MHKKHKLLQRSVGIQSTDNFIPESEPRLCKKAGYRNLLKKSLTVVSQENQDFGEKWPLQDGKKSKSVQVTLDKNPKFWGGDRSGDSVFSEKYSESKEDDLRTTISELVNVTERGTGSANPGTSRRMSGALSSMSILPEVNEMASRPQEGSLAIVYNYGEKGLENSRSSNAAYTYASQGSRRFSDETVILIEDYQSYDYLNAARRQDTISDNQHSLMSCCTRSKRTSTEVLTRPIPLEFENIEEKDETMVCRICHEGEEIEPLIQPCLCKGSIGNVHAHCLKIWLEQSNTSRCELCNYPYAIRQTKKYPKCLSVKVFFQTVVDRRGLAYDIISFVVITPLTLVGVAMCIQASMFSPVEKIESKTNNQIGNITKAGMIMLSTTIIVAYGVWLYTLISYHYKSWKKWYSNCYDVEVLPVRMTSEERFEAAQRLSIEMNRRQLSRERGSTLLTVLQSPNPTNYSFYHRRISVAPVSPAIEHET